MNSPEKEKREQETYESFFAGSDQQKSPIRPQPKPEWSKEDEKSFNNALSGLKYAYEDLINHKSFDSAEDVKNAFNWLKSLRPSWKPSEEHLSALLAVFNDPNNIGSQTCQLALTDLYEQLKKL